MALVFKILIEAINFKFEALMDDFKSDGYIREPDSIVS